ncbi:N-glycosylase/DNA lyase [Oceanotoga sp. DSM 15011]|uniref:N-glycosylase/DNA lyase n=1 Tax=Oceanotoga TaxID=1255275 RepID=UPI0021F49106|nr:MULTISPECIES: N-glycosylase/DNA lyase [Oceanotoga]MDO7977687.1 N-glycosylase/DNA lyase [Oceanotoga teriensis]UYO99642.1 N-glycosylase/DNA lyase [Oceanotoga sp. DSM 15011]
MENLLNELNEIKPIIKIDVENRFKEFEDLGENGDSLDLFSELSFCVMTANWTSKGGIKAQTYIGKEGFAHLSYEDLNKKMKEVGHRFPNTRTKYIIENRWIIPELKNMLKNNNPFEIRKYIAKNVKGIGWKEASHFLRNTGEKNLAILDKHIMRIMLKSNLINELPKSGWNEKKYINMEQKLIPLSKKFGEDMGKLDLYLWYLAKGSIDK